MFLNDFLLCNSDQECDNTIIGATRLLRLVQDGDALLRDEQLCRRVVHRKPGQRAQNIAQRRLAHELLQK